MSSAEPEPLEVLAWYLERAVQGAKGSAVTFSASSVVRAWLKWQKCDKAPERLRHRLSKLLARLATCGLLQAYTRYRYRLVRESPLWTAAREGRARELLSRANCYGVYALYVELRSFE